MNIVSERGVVLHSIKYSENQLILHILTQDSGRKSYITRIAGRQTGRNICQPFYVLDFQTKNSKGNLHKANDLSLAYHPCDTPFNIVKSTISLFLAEVLYRVIREESVDNRLFDFVHSSIIALDLIDGPIANFHLHFMVRLTHYLGFAPQDRYSHGAWFDIKEGSFKQDEPKHMLKMDQKQTILMWDLLQSNVEQACAIELRREDRQRFLDSIIELYGYNTDSIYKVNSISIFKEIF